MNTTNSMDQFFLEKVYSTIEKHFSDPSFNVDQLAGEIGISRYQLSRKLKYISGQSPSQMIREFRLRKALELLRIRAGTISEIAYHVGFSSPSYFDTCFKKHYGYLPGKVRQNTPASILKRYFQSSWSRYVLLSSGFLTVLLLLVLILDPGKGLINGKARSKQTSIAVFPFISQSSDDGDQYLAGAMTDEIIFHLSYNQDLWVMPRISVEQYRSEEKSLKQIGRELNVEYILNGSFQRQSDRVNIIVYLIQTRTNRIIWRNKFSGNWTDIFAIQNRIAQRIARELDIEITPDVQQIMENISATSLDAADYFWRGNVELKKFNMRDSGVLERAEHLFHEAIRLDSAFARAYVGLSWIYWRKHIWDTFLSDDFADSALILADKALSYDRQLAEAYIIRGKYYEMINNKEQALKEFDKAIRLNPSSAEAYRAKARLYIHGDQVNRIENLHKAALLKRGEDLPEILRTLGGAYNNAGFRDIACNYMQSALELDDDSAAYFYFTAGIEHSYGDFRRAIELLKRSYAHDSSDNITIYLIGLNYSFLDNYEEYLEWLRRYEEKQFKNGYTINWATFWGTFRLAHAYGVNGFQEEAGYYVAKGLALYDQMLELDRHFVADIVSFYYMAAAYAFQGNKEKAYTYLNQVNDRKWMPLWMIPCINFDPMFDSLRDEPQFQQIVRDVEAKHQTGHERVGQWLEENDLL